MWTSFPLPLLLLLPPDPPHDAAVRTMTTLRVTRAAGSFFMVFVSPNTFMLNGCDDLSATKTREEATLIRKIRLPDCIVKVVANNILAVWSDSAICFQELLLKNTESERSFTTRFAGGYSISRRSNAKFSMFNFTSIAPSRLPKAQGHTIATGR